MRPALLITLLPLTSLIQAQPGFLDPSFATGGIALTQGCPDIDMGYAIGQQSDGKYVVAGQYFNSMGFGHTLIIRYNENGTVDTGFGSDNTGIVQVDVSPFGDGPEALAIRADDRIVVGGNASFANQYQWYVLGLTADGGLDPLFGGPSSFAADTLNDAGLYLEDLELGANERILIAGGRTSTAVALRLNPDGSPDLTFGAGGYADAPPGLFVAFGRSITEDDQGRAIMCGNTASDQNNSLSSVYRFDQSGVLDEDFGNNGVVVMNLCSNIEEAFTDVLVGPDGAVFLCGSRTDNGVPGLDAVAVRLLPNGSTDATFGTGGVASIALPGLLHSTALDIDVQSDGQVLLDLLASTMDPNSEVMGIARFTADGTLDGTFGTDGYTLTDLSGNITRAISWAMMLDDQERILLTGEATWDNGEVVVARYTNLITASVKDRAWSESGIHITPVAEGYQLTFAAGDGTQVAYQVFNALGGSISIGTGTLIHLQNAPAGAYIVKVATEKSSAVFRVIDL